MEERIPQSPSYILLAGLAATDFATFLITQPFYAACIFAGKNCIVSVIADTASRYFATATAETITVMSTEKWLHISRRSFITVRRSCMIYGVLGFLPVPYLAARLWLVFAKSYLELWEPVLQGSFSLICFSTTTWCYCEILGLIRNQHRKIQANVLSNQSTGGHPAATVLKYKKSVYRVFYILVIFVICYSPHAIFISIHVLTTMPTEAFHVSWYLSATLVLTSFTLNPLHYCWRIKEIRNEAKI